MAKLPKVVFALGIMGLMSDCASAQYPSHIDAARTDRLRNNLWPMPFRVEDSLSVTQVFDVQRNNGWKLYNTLGTPMFHQESHQLTDAGKEHLRRILNYAPAHRRVVFVLKGANAAETAQRVESTQIAISEILPVGNLPPIYLTNIESPGSSGSYQTTINRALVESVPSPRLGQSGSGDTP